MRISIVNPFYDASETFLEAKGHYRHVENLATALAARGHDVTVIQGFQEDRTEKRNTVCYRYVRVPHRSAFRLGGGLLGIDILSTTNLRSVIAALDEARPDAVHMNGMTLLQPLIAVSQWCSRNENPLTVSHHGGVPRRLPWLQAAHGRALANCAAALFATEAHAEAWISTGVLANEKVVRCMEVSSTFKLADHAGARNRTGMRGDPVFVWNARLHEDKDPLTAIKGFSAIRDRWHDARLYMIFLSAEMLSEVRQSLEDLQLLDAVELVGRIPHDKVEDFLNSADFIIQSSLCEVAGYSVVEAMACGVVPILTDIPSFRMMTDNGRVGVLFPPSDHEAMARAVLDLDLSNLHAASQEVREFFAQSLSYGAIAAIYERVFEAPPRPAP
jgi:glycosyltransferase involved in cell wall biosynthesis